MPDGTLHVLLIEDSPADALLVQEALAEAATPFVVTVVERLSEGLGRLAGAHFDAVLLDLGLPDSQGLETFLKIRDQQPGLPVVVLTGLADDKFALKAVQAGAQDYLVKGQVRGDVLSLAIRYAVERKRTEEALRESESLLRESQSIAGLGSYVLDFSTGLWKSSDILNKLFGIDETYVRSIEGWAELIHPAERQQMLDYFTNEVSGQRVRFDKEYKIIRKNDGAERWVHGIGELEVDAQSQLLKMRGTITDITERKTAEDALKTSETNYRRLFEAAKDGILILDANTGEVTDVNPFLIKMLGYSHTEFLGKHLWEIGLLKDIVANRSAFRQLQEKKYTRYEDLPLETIDGHRIFVEFVSNVYDVNGKQIIQCNIRDITERKRAQAALAAKNEELRAMTQQLWQAAKLATMGELAASIAHELNNPLGTVTLRVEELLGRVPAHDPSRYALEVIEQEVERMGALVANLLQFSRRGTQQISSLDVREEIAKTLELIHYQLRQRQVVVAQEFAPDVPLVQADRQQLRQLFLNLFANASDAMLQGGTLTIRVSAAPDGKQVAIEIADTGGGIAPEDLPKVLEPFFTTKPEGKGTGLGLAICRRIAQGHGGTLDLTSAGPGQGATARVTLLVQNGTNGHALTHA